MSIAENEKDCVQRLATHFEAGTTQISSAQLFQGMPLNDGQKYALCQLLEKKGLIRTTNQLGQRLPYQIDILPEVVSERDDFPSVQVESEIDPATGFESRTTILPVAPIEGDKAVATQSPLGRLVDRLQRHPIVIMLSVLGSIASIVALYVVFFPLDAGQADKPQPDPRPNANSSASDAPPNDPADLESSDDDATENGPSQLPLPQPVRFADGTTGLLEINLITNLLPENAAATIERIGNRDDAEAAAFSFAQDLTLSKLTTLTEEETRMTKMQLLQQLTQQLKSELLKNYGLTLIEFSFEVHEEEAEPKG